MKHSKSSLLVLGLILALVLIPVLAAQVKTDKSGADRLEGTIQSIDKAKSTFALRQTGKSVVWQIAYTKDTTFSFRNKSATLDELKEGRRVICLGKFQDVSNMTATRVDVRTEQ